jgi:putative aldouronate transport system permease protein
MINLIAKSKFKMKLSFKENLKKSYPLLFFVLPALIFLFIFCYVPMYGILIAFQDYVPGDPIVSEFAVWTGLKNFTDFFTSYNFWILMKNTFLLCIFGFLVGFPLPVIVALFLNSCQSKKMSRIMQTIFNGPHFISLVVMVGMLYLFFGRYGLINNMSNALGSERVSYFLEPSVFRPLYILSSNWQDFGWSSIIYIAALAGVDPSLHEAAEIDGADRFRRVLYIDFPAIFPTVSVLLILSIGGLMGVGYEKVLLMQTGANLENSEIIATYVYKKGLTGYTLPGFATAVGLFNSIINVILLITANTLSKRFSENALW